MDIQTINKKTDEELQKLLQDERETLRAFRFGEAGSRSRDVKKGQNTKRGIARILTVLRARAIDKNKKSA